MSFFDRTSSERSAKLETRVIPSTAREVTAFAVYERARTGSVPQASYTMSFESAQAALSDGYKVQLAKVWQLDDGTLVLTRPVVRVQMWDLEK